MIAAVPRPLRYRIDRQDRIVSVDQRWDEFAKSNGGGPLSADVIGTHLFDYICDPTVRQLYRRLFMRVRAGVPVRVPFRCDGPGIQRDMLLEMRPAADSGVSFRSHTMSEEHHARHGSAAADRILTVCGWCARVQIGETWISADKAIERLGLFRGPAAPPMSHGICAECHSQVLASVPSG